MTNKEHFVQILVVHLSVVFLKMAILSKTTKIFLLLFAFYFHFSKKKPSLKNMQNNQ